MYRLFLERQRVHEGSGHRKGKSMNCEKELEELKSLVRRFLNEIQFVPMRAVDCDQDKVERLMTQLAEAAKKA
jgi:hypothetical protein